MHVGMQMRAVDLLATAKNNWHFSALVISLPRRAQSSEQNVGCSVHEQSSVGPTGTDRSYPNSVPPSALSRVPPRPVCRHRFPDLKIQQQWRTLAAGLRDLSRCYCNCSSVDSCRAKEITKNDSAENIFKAAGGAVAPVVVAAVATATATWASRAGRTHSSCLGLKELRATTSMMRRR